MEKFKSIILCTYNEEKYICSAINDINNNLNNFEIIIVDDNSKDRTIINIEKLKIKNSIKLITRKKQKGLASAFLRGLLETKGEYVGWIDTNMSYLIEKFNEMEKLLTTKDYDIILLSRYVKGGGDERSLLRSLPSKYLNIFCKLFFNSNINDFTSGIFLMKKNILNETSILGYGHGDFFIEFLYNIEKKEFKIYELPYIQRKDEDVSNSKSAPNIIKFFLFGLLYLIRIVVTKFRNN